MTFLKEERIIKRLFIKIEIIKEWRNICYYNGQQRQMYKYFFTIFIFNKVFFSFGVRTLSEEFFNSLENFAYALLFKRRKYNE